MRTNSRLSISPVFLRSWEYGFVWKGGRGIYNWKWYSANWETNSQQKPANKCNYKSFLLLIAASVPSVEKRNKLEKEYSNFFCRFFPNYFRKIVGHWRGKTYTGHRRQISAGTCQLNNRMLIEYRKKATRSARLGTPSVLGASGKVQIWIILTSNTSQAWSRHFLSTL